MIACVQPSPRPARRIVTDAAARRAATCWCGKPIVRDDQHGWLHTGASLQTAAVLLGALGRLP